MAGRKHQEHLTSRQREVLDLWAVFLYRKGYTTRQVGDALRLSSSTVSYSLARMGCKVRNEVGRLPGMEPDLYAEQWRALQRPPGTALAAGKLNQNGLLTSALKTWESRNALSVFAHRSAEASEAELKDGVEALEDVIAYARQLQRVLADPAFAAEVRGDPSYRDDVGHRFRREAG
jgi:hypothetical protein